jgi:hypothetical protein
VLGDELQIIGRCYTSDSASSRFAFRPQICKAKRLAIGKTDDRHVLNHLNLIFKSTQFAIDDPPPMLPVESYQSKHLFFQDPIGGLVAID